MDEGGRKWLVKTAVANQWRVPPWVEFEDLLQDGQIVYARILNKYPEITERPHLMALFRVAYHNHLNDLSKKRTKMNIEIMMSADDVAKNADDSVLECELARLLMSVAELPAEVRRLIIAIQRYPEKLRCRSRLRTSHRPTTNERLCRLLGLDHSKVDLHSALIEALTDV